MKQADQPSWVSEVAKLSAEYQNAEGKLLEELFHFLRFESISAESRCRERLRECVLWVSKFLKDAGFLVEVWETSVHPVIFAEWNKAGTNQPTVLIYNHYDVQPADPLELWTSPPFEPTIRNGQIYARGAQDNKGQCFSVISVLRHLLARDGNLPVNVKLVIEGEEEIGSRGLAGILGERREQLKADYLMVVDMGTPGPGIPSVTLGLRGILSMTLELEGSNQDLHSGVYGGIVYNPNRALVEMLAAAVDKDGRITIPGFYDDVAVPSDHDRAEIDFDHDISVYERTIGAKATGGEKAYSPLESAWTRPTFEVNGISGGYSGEGFKTVIPARAMAKISCRLVPDQKPARIAVLLEDFFRARVPEGIRMKLTIHPGGGEALRTGAHSPLVNAAADVFQEVLQRPTQRILCGGSVPVIPELARASQSEVVLIGYGLDSDNMHAPNEHYGLDRVRLGFVTIGALLKRVARPAGAAGQQ